jgi:hypothetical protein
MSKATERLHARIQNDEILRLRARVEELGAGSGPTHP